MDPGLQLLAFAIALSAGTAVIWFRLVSLILRGQWPRSYGHVPRAGDDRVSEAPPRRRTGD